VTWISIVQMSLVSSSMKAATAARRGSNPRKDAKSRPAHTHIPHYGNDNRQPRSFLVGTTTVPE
jgi:hypothetical protein